MHANVDQVAHATLPRNPADVYDTRRGCATAPAQPLPGHDNLVGTEAS